MKIPAEVKPALWGAVGGAILLAFIGFTWGGWMTGAQARDRAEKGASAAVVAQPCSGNTTQREIGGLDC